MGTPSLTRTVRMQVPARLEHLVHGPNTYAGTPLAMGIGAYFEVEVRCIGPLDPTSGYVEEIHFIDRHVREKCVPLLSNALASPSPVSASQLVKQLHTAIDSALDSTVDSLALRLSPYHDVRMERNDMNHAILARRYTFSSSHWLRNPELDDEGNYAVFGKCSGPNGHGHNYELEVRILVPASDEAMNAVELDRIVEDHVLARLDHKHLNLDVEEFRELNPTLENITSTCHRILEQHLGSPPGKLAGVRVWETDRTYCEYPPIQGGLNS